MAANAPMNSSSPVAPAQVRPEGGEPDHDGDVTHHLAQQPPSVALDRSAGNGRVVVGGFVCAHFCGS
jgi:hypothetical protein